MQVEITDTVTPAIRALRARLGDSKAVHTALASGALPVFQRNFQTLAASNQNKFGVRGGFWNRMLSGTVAVGDIDAAIVRMPREVALRYFGGTVTPKKSKLLTIPARAEAYGKSARDFNNLRFAVFHGHPALVSRDEDYVGSRKKADGKRTRYDAEGKSSIGKKKQGLKIWYWLTPSATIKANPGVLPSEDEILAAALAAVREELK